ncbi:hypothetical protein ACRZ9O_10190 [Aquirufa sp. HETE-40SA]
MIKQILNNPSVINFLSRGIQGILNLSSLFIITLFFSKTEQGYYYTLISIIGIQIFFELGIGPIILRFVAHERSKVENIFNIKSIHELTRISSIFKITINIFSFFSILFLFIFIFGGINYFNKFHNSRDIADINFIIVSLGISSSLNLFLSGILNFIEGLGYVLKVNKLRLYYQLIFYFLFFILIINNFKLYSLSIASFISNIIIIILLYKFGYLSELFNLLKKYEKSNFSYWNELFPIQWRIALSWISGYFIFQLFTPLAFAIEGPIVAGQLGFTISIFSGITTLTMSLASPYTFLFSSYISNREFTKFKYKIKKIKLLLIFVYFSLALILIIFYNILEHFNYNIIERMLSVKYLFLFSFIGLCNVLIFFWAQILRTFKIEAFLLNSIFGAIIMVLGFYAFGNKYGLDGLVFTYFFNTVFIGFPWAYYIYNKNIIKLLKLNE